MKIEHHIEMQILHCLKGSDHPVSYGELKPEDLVNSHFSYYLRRLIATKMIDKTDAGYNLTVKGARWLNDNHKHLHADQHARVSIGLVIKAGSKFLVAQRKGQMKTTINDYMLPNISYSNSNLQEQLNQAIKMYIPESIKPTINYAGFVQYEVTYIDKVMHRLMYLASCEVDVFPAPSHDHLDLQWLTIKDLQLIEHPSIPILLQSLDTGFNYDKKSQPLIIKNQQ